VLDHEPRCIQKTSVLPPPLEKRSAGEIKTRHGRRHHHPWIMPSTPALPYPRSLVHVGSAQSPILHSREDVFRGSAVYPPPEGCSHMPLRSGVFLHRGAVGHSSRWAGRAAVSPHVMTMALFYGLFPVVEASSLFKVCSSELVHPWSASFFDGAPLASQPPPRPRPCRPLESSLDGQAVANVTPLCILYSGTPKGQLSVGCNSAARTHAALAWRHHGQRRMAGQRCTRTVRRVEEADATSHGDIPTPRTQQDTSDPSGR